MSDGMTDSARGFAWYMNRACGICGKPDHYSAICPERSMCEHKKWVTETVPGGWRVVNERNKDEACRDPEDGFKITVFKSEAKANEMRDVLNGASR